MHPARHPRQEERQKCGLDLSHVAVCVCGSVHRYTLLIVWFQDVLVDHSIDTPQDVSPQESPRTEGVCPQDRDCNAPDKASNARDFDGGEDYMWQTIADRAESLVKWPLSWSL